MRPLVLPTITVSDGLVKWSTSLISTFLFPLNSKNKG